MYPQKKKIMKKEVKEIEEVLILPKDINNFFLHYQQTKGVDLKSEFKEFMDSHSNEFADRVIDVICYVEGVQRYKVESPLRESEVVRARTYICYFLRRKGLSLKQIGSKLGFRNHATIISRIKDFNDTYSYDREFKVKAKQISEQLGIQI